jgi:hypothetical protein
MACEAPSFDLDHSLSQLAGQFANTQGRVETKGKRRKKTAPKPTLKQIKGQGVAGTTLTEAQMVSKTTRSQAHFKKCSAVLLRLQKFWIVSIESNVSMALWQRFGQHLMAPSYRNTRGFQERGSRHLSPP